MPNTRVYTRSFAGGEISPEMFGRIDDAKYQSGAATLRNFIVKPQGPALNRPGTRFVRETKLSAKKSRLIPFTYSNDQTYVLELGEYYLRIHTQAGTLLFSTAGLKTYKGFNTVTLDVNTDTVTWNNHPFVDGDPIFFTTTGQLPSLLALNTVYYVMNVTTNDFQIRTSPTGNIARAFGTVGSGAYTAYSAYSEAQIVSHNSGYFYFRNPLFSTYANPVTSPANATSADWYLEPNTLEYEVPTPYAESHLFDIHYVQSSDVMTLVHPSYPVYELRRYGATDWRMQQQTFVSQVSTPTGLTATPTRGIGLNIKEVRENSATNDLPQIQFVSEHGFAVNDIIYIYGSSSSYFNDKYYAVRALTNPTTITIKAYNTGDNVPWNALNAATFGASNTLTWTGSNLVNGRKMFFPTQLTNLPITTPQITNNTQYYIRNATADTFQISATPTGAIITFGSSGSTYDVALGTDGAVQYTTQTTLTLNSYKVTAVDKNFQESGVQTNPATVDNNLFITDAYNTISWNAVSGAVRYNVYKLQSGLYGYIGQTETTSFRDDNIAPDMGRTPPITDGALTTANNYPAAVTYFEQRRCFSGTNNDPQNIWMTRSGSESDLSYRIPTLDDDRIAFKIAARENNIIRHMVPLNQLVILTSGAEYRVSPVNSDALTPYNVSVRPQSYIGSSNVQPIVVNNALVYCAARGGHIREMGYNWQANGYITGDLSLRAAHLFDDYEIRDMAYAKSPQPMLWFVSNNGKLLGLTYVPEEQIGSWHQHDTDGEFESCAVIAEGEEDYLYVIVKRTINSVTKRYVERMETRNFTSLASSWFVDSGLTRTAAGTESTVSNLGHLENKVVSVVVNGKVQPSKKVIGGSITLTTPATVGQIITVGLPYTSDLQTLPMILNTEAFGQGIVKNVNKVAMRVYRSSEFYIGPDANRLVKSNVYTTTPSLLTEEVDVMIPPSWASGGQVLLRQTDPLPITVVNMSVEVAIGGG